MLRRKVSVSIPRVGEQFSSMPTPAPLYDAVDAPPLTHPQTTTSPDDDDVGSCATDIPATAAAIDGQTALESGAPTDVFDILDAAGAHLSVLEMVQEPRQASSFHSETPCLTEAALQAIAWPGEKDRSRWIRRFQSTMHVPWDQSFERAVLLAAPKDEAELLDIVNGCAFHRMTVRVFYSGHNWSPLLVDTPNVSVSNKVDDSVVFVQLSAASFQRVSLVDAGIFNNARRPPIVTAGGGVGHEQFLKCLEQFSGGRHGIGYGMTHGPAPGDVSLVGTLAVGGHGTAVAIERERAIFGDHALYGTYSNRLIACRAIAWDSQTSRYIVKMYDRSSGSIDHLLTHFGRTIIVDVTMVVEHNCFMRCRSITDVSHEVLVPTQSATAVPAADAPLPERSVAWYVQRYGRVELLWFPFTEKPWLKVWEALDAEGLSAAKKDGSRYVETSYNYAMADRWLPEEITDIMSAITQVPAPSRRLHPGIPMATHAELAASSSGGLTRWPSVTRFVDAVRRLVPNTPEGHLARRVLGDLMCTGLTWILRSPLMTRALPVAGGPSPPLAAASADPGAVDPQVVPDVNLAAGRRAWRAPFVAASNMSPSMSPAAPMRRAKSAAHDRETSTPSTEDASPPAAEDEMPSPAARSPSPSALARFPDLSADAAQKNGTATAAAARATHASNPSVPLAAAAGSSSGNALWGGGMANAIAPQPGVRASLVRSASCCQTNAAARVALMTKLQGALVDRGLDATSTRDICGPSKAVTLYVNHHTVRVTANGYAVATTFQNINAVVDAACSIWRALLKEYAPDACPASQPFEIRVSGMDRPPPFLGHAASPPVSSALPGGNDEEDWDVVVWVDALAIPSARGLSQFFARFEDRLFAHPACCLPRAEIRPEWSKGFAYDATRGAWANEDVLARFRGLYPRWGECMKRLQEADPYDVFQTSWLRQFTRPEHE